MRTSKTAQKSVFVPWIQITEPANQRLLEIVIEPAGCCANAESQFKYLNIHGLRPAVCAALAALQFAGFQMNDRCRPSPMFYPINPPRNINSASGVALGVALGMLMYHRRLNDSRLLASGEFIHEDDSITLKPIKLLREQLYAALRLGMQSAPLHYYVPAHTSDGENIGNTYMEPIAALAQLNIVVRPVRDFAELIASQTRQQNPGRLVA